MELSLEQVIAIGTLVNGSIVAYIGYQQYLTQKHQKEIEEKNYIASLFDRRFDIFKTVQKSLSLALREAAFEYKDLGEITAALQQSYFLFDDEIYKYIGEVRKQLITLASSSRILKDRPVDELTRQKALKDNHESIRWIAEELTENGMFLKFKTYLRH